MAAGKHGSQDVVVAFDDSGGNVQTMTPYITEINGLDIEAITEESTAFGDTWMKNLAVGVSKGADVSLGGYYDDTATTGPDAIFNALPAGPATATRTLTITFATDKTFSCEVIIVKYTRTLAFNALTKFTVLLRPSGTITG